MRSVVVLPTYNEIENIVELIEKIFSLGLDLGVVVIDDNSPDGTGQAVDLLARKFDNIYVIHRQGRRGIGFALKEGLAHALNLDVEYIFEMDADLSHNPEDMSRFLEAMEGHDLVMGSRFISDASYDAPLARKILSVLSKNFICFALGLHKITDPNSGFRCFRKEALKKIDFLSFSSGGRSFVEELLCKFRKDGIKEIPIRFTARCGGRSKLTINDLIECVVYCVKSGLAAIRYNREYRID